MRGKKYEPIEWTCITYAHNIIVFIYLCFCSLHKDNNGIILKNVHFEIRSGSQNSVVLMNTKRIKS